MSEWVRRHLDRWSNLSEQLPVDVLPASNGEFIPPPPTAQQHRVMALQDDAAEQLRARLGMSRRTFVRSASAIGVGFWAINQVMPGKWGRYLPGTGIGEAAGPIGDSACSLEFPEAQLNNLPGEFIFDVQTHHVDSGGTWRVNNPGVHAAFMALWTQSGPLGGEPHVGKDGHIYGFGKGGEVDPIENLSRYHYLKTIFLDSSTNMTVLSCVPSEESQQPLPTPEAHDTVKMINHLAGNSPRSVMHAFVMPNRGSYGVQPYVKNQRPAFQQAEFDLMEQHVRSFKDALRGWKVYTPWGDVPYASGWFLDDEIGMAFIDQVRKLTKIGGPPVIACHKGFALPAFDHRAASPRDIGPAARQNRDINFVVYHSGFDSETQKAYAGDDKVNSADRGVDCFIKSLRENHWDATRFVPKGLAHGNVPNVFAEIGSTMASVLGDPDQAAHLMGKLITFVGPLRIAWGTDSLWFGSPQPIIAGLRSLHLTAKACEFYNLPYGLDGDAWDPRVNALSAHSYAHPHRHVSGWPTDHKAHPERTIRNRIFGRNAATVYQVEPDVARHKIHCDDVQKMRDAYLINPATPKEMRPFATNRMPAGRTPQQVLANTWPNAPFTP
jgi:predicted TIM-barrel fold metal-dependent hydrolase